MTIFRFALLRAVRRPLNVLVVGLIPLGLAFLPASQDWSAPIGFQMYGGVLLFGAFLLLRSVMDDESRGVMVRLGASPLPEFRYLLENLLAFGLILVLQSALMVVLGLAVHGPAIKSPFFLWLAYALFSLLSLAFSLAATALAGSRPAMEQLLTFLILLLILLILGLLVVFVLLFFLCCLLVNAFLIHTCFVVEIAAIIIKAAGFFLRSTKQFHLARPQLLSTLV